MDGVRADHECVAVHCSTCCPQRRAYDEGYDFARELFRDPYHLGPDKTDIVQGVILFLFLIAFFVWGYAYGRRGVTADGHDG